MTLAWNEPSQSPYAKRGRKRDAARRAQRTPITAYVSSARPYETILFFWRTSVGFDAVSALVDRRSGALALVSSAARLDSAERSELERLARGPASAPPLSEVPFSVARARLRRALLATRIAGGEVPAWLVAQHELVGDPVESGLVAEDVYACFACDAPLPVHEQLARAERHGLGEGPPRCPHCRGDSRAPDSEGETWLGRAWLMIAAGLPERALSCAARAEAAKLRGERLLAVRGAAHLALGERTKATELLSRALEHEPAGERADRLRGWLVVA